jgi:biotin carboxylase
MAELSAPTVLLVGVDRYVFRACERLGVDAVVIYGPGSKDAGSAVIPDRMTGVFVDDQRNAEAVVAALERAGQWDRHYDAVLATNEYTLALGGLLARALGCRGMSAETAVRFRDKALQKRAVRAAGVPVAECVLVEDIQCPGDIPDLGRRMVLKPIAGAGTKFTTVVSDILEFRAAAARFARTSSLRTFLVEEYIEGDEWMVDGVVSGGELAFYSVAYYGDPCLTAVQQQSPLTLWRFDPITDQSVYQAAEPVARRALAALGLQDGVFHMELFRPSNGGPLVFGECAARRGAALVLEEVLYKFSVDLAEEALRAALGWQPRLDVKIRPGYVATSYLKGRPGVLISCPSVADVLARQGARYARIELPVGASIEGQFGDTSTRVGQVMVAADDPGQLTERFADIRRWFDERLIVAPADASHRALLAWQGHTWPDAGLGDAPLFEPDHSAAEEQA